jgi:prephenate dehydrogenase
MPPGVGEHEKEDLLPEGSRLISKGTAVVVGGAGRMGSMLAGSLAAAGMKVVIYDLDERKALKAARRLGVRQGGPESAALGDIVVVSVPVKDTVNVCLSTAIEMRPGSLLVEISSVKTGVVEKVEAGIPDMVEYASMHPLFGPEAASVKGGAVVLIPVRLQRWRSPLYDLMERIGWRIVLSDVEEHDRAMAVVQVLHHFSYLCLASSVSQLGIDMRFCTRSLERTLRILRRLNRDLGVILSIQRENPFAAEVRKAYCLSVLRLAEDQRSFEESVRESLRRLFEEIV